MPHPAHRGRPVTSLRIGFSGAASLTPNAHANRSRAIRRRIAANTRKGRRLPACGNSQNLRIGARKPIR